MKTKFRNKLDNESINGLLRLKQLILIEKKWLKEWSRNIKTIDICIKYKLYK